MADLHADIGAVVADYITLDGERRFEPEIRQREAQRPELRIVVRTGITLAVTCLRAGMVLVKVVESDLDRRGQPRDVFWRKGMGDPHVRMKLRVLAAAVAVARLASVLRHVEDRLGADRHEIEERDFRRRRQDRIAVIHEAIAQVLGVEGERERRGNDRRLLGFTLLRFVHNLIDRRRERNTAAHRGCTQNSFEFHFCFPLIT